MQNVLLGWVCLGILESLYKDVVDGDCTVLNIPSLVRSYSFDELKSILTLYKNLGVLENSVAVWLYKAGTKQMFWLNE